MCYQEHTLFFLFLLWAQGSIFFIYAKVERNKLKLDMFRFSVASLFTLKFLQQVVCTSLYSRVKTW